MIAQSIKVFSLAFKFFDHFLLVLICIGQGILLKPTFRTHRTTVGTNNKWGFDVVYNHFRLRVSTWAFIISRHLAHVIQTRNLFFLEIWASFGEGVVTDVAT